MKQMKLKKLKKFSVDYELANTLFKWGIFFYKSSNIIPDDQQTNKTHSKGVFFGKLYL
jgi:hypothetical protein